MWHYFFANPSHVVFGWENVLLKPVSTSSSSMQMMCCDAETLGQTGNPQQNKHSLFSFRTAQVWDLQSIVRIYRDVAVHKCSYTEIMLIKSLIMLYHSASFCP
jgi:hypothetical protein